MDVQVDYVQPNLKRSERNRDAVAKWGPEKTNKLERLAFYDGEIHAYSHIEDFLSWRIPDKNESSVYENRFMRIGL